MVNEDEKTGDIVNESKVKNMQPPDMIKDADDFFKYKKRLQRWSRLCSLSPQAQFDVVMNSIDVSHPLCDRLEDEIGDSEEANTQGINVILEKLEEIYGKEEEIDAFKNYKEFEEKFRKDGQDLLQFLNEWEALYNKLKAKGDTLSDRILAFKLIVACNLDETEHKLVFRESKSKEKDGKF